MPVIAAPVPKIEVREHKNISLECLVTGDPAPAVSWFKVIYIILISFTSIILITISFTLIILSNFARYRWSREG